MRESMGGAMLFWIVLTFMSIFIGFLASVTQYGKVFRIKNAIINYIEQSEGITDDVTLHNFDAKLKSLRYEKGWVLCREDFENPSRDGSYYFITLYAEFQIPLIPAIKVPIKGDTRMVETGIHLGDSSNIFIFNPEFSKNCRVSDGTPI